MKGLAPASGKQGVDEHIGACNALQKRVPTCRVSVQQASFQCGRRGNMERCRSGLSSRFRKPVCPFAGTAGSNPALSVRDSHVVVGDYGRAVEEVMTGTVRHAQSQRLANCVTLRA